MRIKLLIPVFSLLILFFCQPEYCLGQKKTKIKILNADVLEYKDLGDTKVKRLIGHVKLQHQNTILHCDSALFQENINKIFAQGHVHIEDENSIDVYGDSLIYDGNEKTAELYGNVVLTDDKMRLTTDHLRYNTGDNIAYYNNGGTLVNKENTLTSKIGYYDAKSKNIYFKDSVKLVNPEYIIECDTLIYNNSTEIVNFVGPTTISSPNDTIYCESGWYNTNDHSSEFTQNAWIKTATFFLSGDTLEYNRDLGIGKAYNDVSWTDSSGKTILTGDYAEYYESDEHTLVTKNPIMINVMQNDSLFLAADTLHSMLDSSKKYRLFLAYNDVKIFRKDFQAVADSLSFSYEDSIFRLYHDPVVWFNETQMFADTITIELKEEVIHRIILKNDCFIISEEVDPIYNQIKGKNVIGYFKNDSLVKMNVIGNGQSIYYAVDDSDAFVGANKAECSDILLKFKDNKLAQVLFIFQPDATFLPMTQIDPLKLRLDGFAWMDYRHPKSKEELWKARQ